MSRCPKWIPYFKLHSLNRQPLCTSVQRPSAMDHIASQPRLARTVSSDSNSKDSILRWAVPVGSADGARVAASRRHEECLQRRRERAQSCGLEWLRSTQKHVGKTSRNDKWVNFLHVSIERDCEEWLETEAITKTPPAC